MQIIIPLTYALADIWLNLSVYGDMVFTVARTLLLVLMTHLLTWSRETTPFVEEETKVSTYLYTYVIYHQLVFSCRGLIPWNRNSDFEIKCIL